MEPIELLGFAGVAAAGWALGRASRRGTNGQPAPGDTIADAGTRLSRNAAFGAAALGSRALMLSAAGVAFAGSTVARGVGIGADMTLAAGDAFTGAARRAISRRPKHEHEVILPATDTTPAVEQADSGLVVPVDANATV